MGFRLAFFAFFVWGVLISVPYALAGALNPTLGCLCFAAGFGVLTFRSLHAGYDLFTGVLFALLMLLAFLALAEPAISDIRRGSLVFLLVALVWLALYGVRLAVEWYRRRLFMKRHQG